MYLLETATTKTFQEKMAEFKCNCHISYCLLPILSRGWEHSDRCTQGLQLQESRFCSVKAVSKFGYHLIFIASFCFLKSYNFFWNCRFKIFKLLTGSEKGILNIYIEFWVLKAPQKWVAYDGAFVLIPKGQLNLSLNLLKWIIVLVLSCNCCKTSNLQYCQLIQDFIK